MKTMSESSDSFEEFKFEETVLSKSSAINQTSIEPASHNQRLESENSATTMTTPTDQVKTVLLKDLEFELAWETRDLIIASLNQHSKLLSGLVITLDARKTIQKANIDLISTLMNLLLKNLEASVGLSGSGSNEVVLDLKWEVRSRVIDLLMTNHKIALLDGNFMSDDCKSKLADQNNDLICELLKLRSRTVAISGDSSESNEDHLIDRRQAAKANESKVAGEANGTNVEAKKPIEHPMADQTIEKITALKEELKKFMTASEKKTDDLVKEIDELTKEIDGQSLAISDLKKDNHRLSKMTSRNQTSFTFELNGINALLDAAGKRARRSEFFYCSGFPWYLSVLPQLIDGVKYLAVFLYPANNIEDQWSVVATFGFRLLSSVPGPIGGDVVMLSKDSTFKKSDSGLGYSKFVSAYKLRTGSFIQNDTIKIRADLSTKNFEIFNL